MKKICIVTPSLGKYSETFIQNQINYLPFEKFIITTGNGEFANKNGLPLANRGFLAKAKRAIGRKFLNEDFEMQQNSLLVQFLKKNKVEHVLFQYGTTAKKGFSACVQARIPFTIHFHGYDAYTYDYGKNYYEDVLKYSSNVIVVSQHMKRQLMKLGCTESKLTVIPYGSDFKIDNPSENQKETKTKFLAIGRFVEKKAPYLTILAFAEALKYDKDLQLDMLGDGKLLNVCKDIVEGIGAGNNIRFHGALDHSAVKKMLSDSNFFIQHSKTASNGDSEGLPNAIIEALTLKKPVISTYHSGIPEIIKHGVNGLLSDENDILAMSSNILKAIEYEFEFPVMRSLEINNSIKELAALLDR